MSITFPPELDPITTLLSLNPSATYSPSSVYSQVIAITDSPEIASEFVSLYEQDNTFYNFIPSLGGNAVFTALFGLLLIAHFILGIFYKQRFFGIAFFGGLALEFIGYLARSLANGSPNNENDFLAQIICLTIAPCFIMGAYYYLFAKNIVILTPKYSLFPPMAYSYMFITADIISLVLQAAGGGIAGVALTDNDSTETGTHIMVAGLAFQVFTMSVFMFFWIWYYYGLYFCENEGIKTVSMKNVLDISHKEDIFDDRYANIRAQPLYKYYPLVILFGTLAIYTRCIYRVIELAEGWSGFLITHENYLFCLDGMTMLIACFILLPPFYPGYVFGRNTKVSVPKKLHGNDKNNTEEEEGQKQEEEEDQYLRENKAYDATE